MATHKNTVFRLLLLAALFFVMQARATTIQIDIDTTSLALGGQNWDLAFDFIDGDGIPQSNSVTISNFAITGGSLTGASPYPIVSGDVTGDLSTAPPVILRDSSFSEYLDNANLGSLLTFVLEITGNTVSGLTPDAFSFFFVNPGTGETFHTSDPTGADALFVYSIGNDNQPELFCPDDTDCLTVTPVVSVPEPVPEPGALALAVAALLALGVTRFARKSLLRA